MTITKNAWAAVVAVLATLAVVAVLMFTPLNSAGATDGDKCTPSPAIPATTGTPEIPAVTTTVEHPATPAVYGPDLWWNWSPNKDQGPFEGPPAFPVDARGTWQGPHQNGGPSQDTYGTFQQGNGNGSWFHREKGVEITPAKDAWTETIVVSPAVPAVPGTPAVPAVVCPETPDETPVGNPNPTPETPDNDGPKDGPKETPAPPKDVQVTQCVDGVFVTTVNGEVVSESGTCDESTSVIATTPAPAQEEGL